jgi:hypothetical protein
MTFLDGIRYTVIPRYTSNRFTNFRLYELHKLIRFSIYEPIFAYTSSLSQTDRCSRREWEINFRKLVFALQAVLEELIKLVNRGITVVCSVVWPGNCGFEMAVESIYAFRPTGLMESPRKEACKLGL